MSKTRSQPDGKPDDAGKDADRPQRRVQRAFSVNTSLWDNVLQAAGAGLGTILGALLGFVAFGRLPTAILGGAVFGFVGGVFTTGLILAIYRWFRPFEPDE